MGSSASSWAAGSGDVEVDAGAVSFAGFSKSEGTPPLTFLLLIEDIMLYLS